MVLEKRECANGCGSLCPIASKENYSSQIWICRICGDKYYISNSCENTIKDKAYKNFISAIDKRTPITDQVNYWANEILKNDPDDLLANMFVALCHENKSAFPEFLQSYGKAYINSDNFCVIFAHVIKHIKAENISDWSIFIDNVCCDGENVSVLRTEYDDLVEGERQGIFDPTCRRTVFVAHSSKDWEDVLTIVGEIERAGYSCFSSPVNMRHGVGADAIYEETIKSAIEHCDIFLFISSKNSRNLYCDAIRLELNYVEEQDRKRAPEEYYNKDYDLIPTKYKKMRIQYVLDGNGDKKSNDAVDKKVGMFFSGYTYKRNVSGLLNSIKSLKASMGNVEIVEELDSKNIKKEQGEKIENGHKEIKKRVQEIQKKNKEIKKKDKEIKKKEKGGKKVDKKRLVWAITVILVNLYLLGLVLQLADIINCVIFKSAYDGTFSIGEIYFGEILIQNILIIMWMLTLMYICGIIITSRIYGTNIIKFGIVNHVSIRCKIVSALVGVSIFGLIYYISYLMQDIYFIWTVIGLSFISIIAFKIIQAVYAIKGEIYIQFWDYGWGIN